MNTERMLIFKFTVVTLLHFIFNGAIDFEFPLVNK
jgi:hypothetical protein